ncbi:glutathione S-transferase 1-1-like isoform X2 [Colletes gigas]|nr:glutathione S-transferase 1-1-like isoform X2 [Colletes gigas]XP_043252857.1 glutathione S-transferase 1-1-like isoform X2 [Colletes gigas]
MAKVVLYSDEISPPCRSVLLTAKAIGLELNILETSLASRDHLKEDYLKINPQHTIPALNDNGFILAESHVIACYLVDKYAKNDSLYPKDLQKRALINQQLIFDAERHFNPAKRVFKPIIFLDQKEIAEEGSTALKEAYEIMDKHLEGKKWFVGDSYTLADLCSAATTSSTSVVINLDDYPNVKAWLQRCEKELPGYKEVNLPGATKLHAAILAKLA